MFIVHCVLCSCLCENAHLHLVERGKNGAGVGGGTGVRGGSLAATLTYFGAAHRAHFSPQQMTCHVFIISAEP